MSDSSPLARQQMDALNTLAHYQRDALESLNEKHDTETKALDNYLNQTHDPIIERQENRIGDLKAILNRSESDDTVLNYQIERWQSDLQTVQTGVRSLKDGKHAQIETLAVRQHNELLALSAVHRRQSESVQNSDDPLRTVVALTGEQDKIYDRPEAVYKPAQPGLGRAVDTSTLNPAKPAHTQQQESQGQESNSPLEQAKVDLKHDKEATSFDKIAQRQNHARDNFNQVSDPFSQEQTNTRDR